MNGAYILCWLCTLSAVGALCPDKCSCKWISENDFTALRVKCGGSQVNRISAWDELDFGDDSKNIISMDVSNNSLNRLEKQYFKNYTQLKRLDLSFNGIQVIETNSFGNGLHGLERLKLSNNLISQIFSGSLDNLTNLKQLDISNNPLVCDCDLIWLHAWSNIHLVKLQPAPKCEAPNDFKGTLLKKLKVGQDMHCESPLQPLLELLPNQNQIVFDGDELTLKCRAPRIAIGVRRESEDLPSRAHVFWGWSEKIQQLNSTEDIIYKDPSIVFSDVHLESRHSTDSGILHSILKIEKVTKNHTGMWDCTLRSQEANLSKTIIVIVLSKSTQYCKAVNVKTNKGNFYWPKTVCNQTVEQKCIEEVNTNSVARYFCGSDGVWINLDTKSCPFVSETTRALEQFTKVNFTLTNGKTLEIARRLHNFTQTSSRLKKLRDPIDLEFIAKTLLKYIVYIENQQEISYLLLDIISQLLLLPYEFFYESQRLYKSGTKLLKAVEVASKYIQTSSLIQHDEIIHTKMTRKNIFIENFNIRLESFTGISCIWFSTDSERIQRIFECSTSNDSYPLFEKYIEAAIQIPKNLFNADNVEKNIKLMIAIYRNANLLPIIDFNTTTTSLTSAVIGASIFKSKSEQPILDQSGKISIMLRARPYHKKISMPEPAWWDNEMNSWNTKACEKVYLHRGLQMFVCDRLGYYGLLQRTEYLNEFENSNMGAIFRFAPLCLYVGSVFLFFCSWINITTYVSLGSFIRINRQQRHSLVNTWLASSTLAVIFAIGIFQTEHMNICRIFGILMHYFTMSTLLWLCVSLSSMYKRLSKNHHVVTESDMPNDSKDKKPILGIYLVGWGIGMIICGISSAVNLNEYASYSFCFLHDSSAFNAILVPATILLLFLAILFICIYYHINHKVINVLQINQFSDNTQATENIDLDWMDSTKPINLDQYRSLSLSNPLSSIVDDFERSNMAHLRAHLTFLFLFVIGWISAANCIVNSRTNEYNSQMYSFVFVASCTLLGVFMLLFYTCSRNDTKNECGQRFCFPDAKVNGSHNDSYNMCTRTSNTVLACPSVYDCNSESRSNSQCSKHHAASIKSTSYKNTQTARSFDCPAQHLLCTASEKCSTIKNNRHCKSNLNVAIMHEIPNAELFYNPNQINVARKFFKKQKRLVKRNNFELQRNIDRFENRDNMSDETSLTGNDSTHIYSKRHNAMTMLSGGSKINNTNIHVTSYNKTKANRNAVKNPYHVDLNRSNFEHRIRVISKTNLLANIYTNIPETREPQHEIIKVYGVSENCMPMSEETFSDYDNTHHEISLPEKSTPLYENTLETNLLPTCTLNQNKPPQSFAIKTFKTEQEKMNCQKIVELDDVKAMNSLGLPESNIYTNRTENPEQKFSLLQKGSIYISNSLQVTDHIEVDCTFSSVLLRCSQKQSKSLNNLNDILGYSFQNVKNLHLSYDNITNCIENEKGVKNVSLKTDSKSIYDFREKSLPSNTDRNDLIEQRMRAFSASPTYESDLNYQNSEISIRSHGLYAPQGDIDLNLTLTEDYPYQSSNASETDDLTNDLDEEFIKQGPSLSADFKDTMGQETMNTSIDELYEAIKRHSSKVVEHTNVLTTNTSFSNKTTLNNTVLNKALSSQPYSISNIIKDNLNDTIEDDSSQSSIISYIDSKINFTKNS